MTVQIGKIWRWLAGRGSKRMIADLVWLEEILPTRSILFARLRREEGTLAELSPSPTRLQGR